MGGGRVGWNGLVRRTACRRRHNRKEAFEQPPRVLPRFNAGGGGTTTMVPARNIAIQCCQLVCVHMPAAVAVVRYVVGGRRRRRKEEEHRPRGYMRDLQKATTSSTVVSLSSQGLLLTLHHASRTLQAADEALRLQDASGSPPSSLVNMRRTEPSSFVWKTKRVDTIRTTLAPAGLRRVLVTNFGGPCVPREACICLHVFQLWRNTMQVRLAVALPLFF